MKKTLLLATLGVATALGAFDATAQIAGTTTTIGVTITEASEIARGWSVKKGILGKTVYNNAGEKVGNVQDLIITPENHVSYVIVGAGGFIGMGRHDVAIPISQIRDTGGKIVMAGATKEIVKSMPTFAYANDTAARDQFTSKARQDIVKARAEIAALEHKSATAAGDAKTKLDADVVMLKKELASADDKLSEMERTASNRWREFEGGVSAAVARLKKSLEKTTG